MHNEFQQNKKEPDDWLSFTWNAFSIDSFLSEGGNNIEFQFQNPIIFLLTDITLAITQKTFKTLSCPISISSWSGNNHSFITVNREYNTEQKRKEKRSIAIQITVVFRVKLT